MFLALWASMPKIMGGSIKTMLHLNNTSVYFAFQYSCVQACVVVHYCLFFLSFS